MSTTRVLGQVFRCAAQKKEGAIYGHLLITSDLVLRAAYHVF